jgi:hypothetical protein
MSDTTVTAEGAPITLDPANANAPAAAPAAKPASAAGDEPSWLGPRLERERAKLLKDLGVESLDDAKKAVGQAKAAEDAQKSDAQKRGELETTLKKELAEKQALSEALGSYAKSQLGALTEEQRNAVAALAGDDPAKQLKAIETLKPTWASAAASAAPVAASAPKDTAPAAGAPKEGHVPPPSDKKAIYEEAKKTNPVWAARYALENGLFENK